MTFELVILDKVLYLNDGKKQFLELHKHTGEEFIPVSQASDFLKIESVHH